MVGKGAGFKKEDILQRDVAYSFPGPQCEYLRRVLAFCQQTRMDLAQTPRSRRPDLPRLLLDIVKRFQVILKGAPCQIAMAGNVNQCAVRVPPPQFLPQPEARFPSKY